MVAELLTKADYDQRVIKPMLDNPDPSIYWTEVQWLDEGKYDLVSCRVNRDFVDSSRWKVDRWWHSQQHGYWETMEECIHHAMNFPNRKLIYVVDMRKEA